jgi:hypothetical protein
MKPDKVIPILCGLVTAVGAEIFEEQVLHDCFCGQNAISPSAGAQIDGVIIKYIECAVREKINRDRGHAVPLSTYKDVQRV